MQYKIKCQQGKYVRRADFEEGTSQFDARLIAQVQNYLMPDSQLTNLIDVSQQVPLIGYWLSKEVRTRNSPSTEDQDWLLELDKSKYFNIRYRHQNPHVEFLQKVLGSNELITEINHNTFKQIQRKTDINIYFIDLRFNYEQPALSVDHKLICFKLLVGNQEKFLINFQSNRYPIMMLLQSSQVQAIQNQQELWRPRTLQHQPIIQAQNIQPPQRAPVESSDLDPSRKKQRPRITIISKNSNQIGSILFQGVLNNQVNSNIQVSQNLMDTQIAQLPSNQTIITNMTLVQNSSSQEECGLCQQKDLRQMKLPCNCLLHKACFDTHLDSQEIKQFKDLKCPLCQEELPKQIIKDHLSSEKYERLIRNQSQSIQILNNEN